MSQLGIISMKGKFLEKGRIKAILTILKLNSRGDFNK